jgi:four helix bundle protein
MPQDFKNVEVWKLSFEYALDIYKNVIPSIPKDELYGLSSQLRRAVLSISNNISEGCGRKTQKDFASFLYNALGSTKEVENLLLFSKQLGFISETKHKELNDRLEIIGKKLMNFLKSVEGKID